MTGIRHLKATVKFRDYFGPVYRGFDANGEDILAAPYRLNGRTLHLFRDEVLIRLEKPERMTAAKTLWIPDSAQRRDSEVYQGTVLAHGPGQFRKKDGGTNPIEVSVGDRVVFYFIAGEVAVNRLFDDSTELRIIKESSIQGVIE